jgi:hypothetical protein
VRPCSIPAFRRSFSFADSCNRRRGWQAGRSYSHRAASTGARIDYLLLKVIYHACAESGLSPSAYPPICAGGCPLVSSGYAYFRTRTFGQDPTLASRPRPLSTKPAAAITGVPPASAGCRWPLHARSKRDTNAASPICCSAAVPSRQKVFLPVCFPLWLQLVKGLPHGGGHA